MEMHEEYVVWRDEHGGYEEGGGEIEWVWQWT